VALHAHAREFAGLVEDHNCKHTALRSAASTPEPFSQGELLTVFGELRSGREGRRAGSWTTRASE
jgi:hypothetical protein